MDAFSQIVSRRPPCFDVQVHPFFGMSQRTRYTCLARKVTQESEYAFLLPDFQWITD